MIIELRWTVLLKDKTLKMRPQKVPLPNLDPLRPQNIVRRHHMKVKVGQVGPQQMVQPGKLPRTSKSNISATFSSFPSTPAGSTPLSSSFVHATLASSCANVVSSLSATEGEPPRCSATRRKSAETLHALVHLERERVHVVDEAPGEQRVERDVLGRGVGLGEVEDAREHLEAAEVGPDRDVVEGDRHGGGLAKGEVGFWFWSMEGTVVWSRFEGLGGLADRLETSEGKSSGLVLWEARSRYRSGLI